MARKAAANAGAPAPHITLDVDADGVALVLIDVQGEPVNTLSPALMADFDRILDTLESTPGIRAVVVASGKPGNFVAGADIRLIRDAQDPREAETLARELQRRFGRLETLHTELGPPVIAAIDGAAMGGGLELALACSGRIASDSPKTVLGLPEVKIGVLPAGGGCTRLPRLVGIAAALDLILSGRELRPRQARKIGLVDEVVPAPLLIEVAKQRALAAAGRTLPAPSARFLEQVAHAVGIRPIVAAAGDLAGLVQAAALESNPVGRAVLFHQARETLRKKTRGNYPATDAALEAIRIGVEQGPEAGYRAEAERFGRLAVSPEAKALMSLFFATQELKRETGTDSPAEARPVRRLGILGGGLMGAGIATLTVMKADLPVRMRDVDPAGAARALSHVRGELQRLAKRGRFTPMAAERRFRHVTATTGLEGFGGVDLVVEAVPEDLALKRRVLREFQEQARPGAVFASNTSSIPIARIAEGALRPGDVVGMHYFSPVEKMPLLEVIAAPRSSGEAVATAVAVGKLQGKTVIVVHDGPGFYTTRILAPYLNEAARLLTEGAGIAQVDEALMDFGFPVGPITLMDEVGIDVGEKVAHVLVEAFGDRFRPPEALAAVVADGRKGRKNGRGFFLYQDGRKRGPDESVHGLVGVRPDPSRFQGEDLAWRVTLPLVNEAVRCLEEGILRSPRDGDVGAVFGLGFPPFTGGPFSFVDHRGPGEIVHRLDALAAIHGPRFEPCRLLREHAATGRRFRT